MLIVYSRFQQDGIESLENFSKPVKDADNSHYFFDDFRIALFHNYNEVDNCSGVGVLIFAPNGSIWCQRGVYCYEFQKYVSLYYAIEQILEEAEKSKAKNITIYVEDKEFAEFFKYLDPYKQDEYNKIHNYIIEKLSQYDKFNVEYRIKFPKDTIKRLHKEAKQSSRSPKFDHRGNWKNQLGIIYFDIKEETEEDIQFFARQLADLYYSYSKSYLKEYAEDYGEEALKLLISDIKENKIKKLPDTKRVKEKKVRFKVITDYPQVKKMILCQNCEMEMILEKCLMKYPEKELRYYYRCLKCKATQELNEKGRVICYGKFPNLRSKDKNNLRST